jgi:outer membrane protein assembly factor BamB
MSENAGPISLSISPDNSTLWAGGTINAYGMTNALFDGVAWDGNTHPWISKINMASGAHSATTILAASAFGYGVAASNDAVYVAHSLNTSFVGSVTERRNTSGAQVWVHTNVGSPDGWACYDCPGHQIAYSGGAVYVVAAEYFAGTTGYLFSLDASSGSQNWRKSVNRDNGNSCFDENYLAVSGSTIYLAGSTDTRSCSYTNTAFDAPIVMAAGQTLSTTNGGAYIMGFNAAGTQTVGAREISSLSTPGAWFEFRDLVVANGGYAYAMGGSNNNSQTLTRFLLPTN